MSLFGRPRFPVFKNFIAGRSPKQRRGISISNGSRHFLIRTELNYLRGEKSLSPWRKEFISIEKNIFLHGDNSKGIGGKGTECLWKERFPLI